MGDRHLSEDELLDKLYGVSVRSGNHLEACAACRDRWTELSQARAAELARQQPDIPEALLVRQQRKVMTVIEGRTARVWLPRPLPALALALVCAVAVVLSRPAPVPEPYRISDAQFFSEVYSVAESTEPQSAAPIQNLFQGGQQ